MIDTNPPPAGDSLQTSSEHTGAAKRPVLHDNHVWAYYRHFPDNHVWAYYRHFPLEADPSLYNKAKHSLKSHHELLNLFLDDCRRGSVLPAADAAYAAESLTELAEQRRKGFRQWQARQAGRKNNAGRPSLHAQGEEQAQALEALAADVVLSAVINVTAHRLAFELLEAEREKYALQLEACRAKGDRSPRRTRGRRTNNLEKFDMAMQVDALLAADPGRSEASAIREVAIAWFQARHPEAKHLRSDNREDLIDRWYKKIEASYYERKPYLRSTKEPFLNGMIPLDLVLDD